MLMDAHRSAFCPYLDPALVDFCASLPFEITADAKFHDAVIATSFPDIRTPYQEGVQGFYPKSSYYLKLREILEAISAKKRLGLWPLVAEPVHQIRMLTDPQLRRLAFWRAYGQSLRAVRGSELRVVRFGR